LAGKSLDRLALNLARDPLDLMSRPDLRLSKIVLGVVDQQKRVRDNGRQ
jgi:hypothetical protein